MIAKIAPEVLRSRTLETGELSVVDIQEAGQFGRSHLLIASNLPFSILEAGIRPLVPRLSTDIVLIDGTDDGLAVRAAERLRELGYARVQVLDGGVSAWANAGFEVFEGVNVPTKAFAETVLEHFHTPEITAPELKKLMETGSPFTLVDGRTQAEHRVRCIPGSTALPNGELLLHIGDVAPPDNIPIIVHCAGRTRSIIGAQTLLAAGLDNPVFALRGGTQEWTLNGFDLDRGNTQSHPDLTPKAQELSARLVAQLSEHDPNLTIDRPTFDAWQLEDSRTLYLFDVRTKEEFEAGHFPGAVHAPAGQLVHAVDLWAGTRGARIALLDTAPYARAAMAAYWLRLQGWEAAAPDFLQDNDFSQAGCGPKVRAPAQAPRISAEALASMNRDDLTIFDVGDSAAFRKGHLPGAVWLNRSKLEQTGRSGIDRADGTVIIYGENADDPRADLVAADLKAHSASRDVRVVDGGRHAWLRGGGATEASPARPSEEESIDFLFWLHDRHTGNAASARAYLDWELSLVERVRKDGTLRFLL